MSSTREYIDVQGLKRKIDKGFGEDKKEKSNMVKMMTSCGRCSHYTNNHRCGNANSKHFGERQLSNVCWQCRDFNGKLYPWDSEKAHPVTTVAGSQGLLLERIGWTKEDEK